ncbi:zinc ABC transporter substrate-binding protein [Arthrobacter sp. LAPM80]|uniref:metal ABC transporter solute-binding protein, Zn/Mn family n=1 Tax=Arthrobacter sp. LAPM80 TaxID=3141788 RepID=UPI00398A7C33
MTRSRRPLLLVGAALAASLTLAACGGGGGAGAAGGTVAPAGTISVVASTNVYGDIAQAVGGAYVEVHAIISKPGADPHSYEANAQDKLAVSKAQIGIENGGGYDGFFGQLAAGQLNDKEIINVSELSGLDTGADFNEHVWYSLPTMAKLADELAARFSKALPADASAFTAQAGAFKDKLTGLDTRLAAMKKTRDGEGVAITEPVPLYMLEQAGLVNKTPAKFTEAVENGSDAPVSAVTDTMALLASKSIVLLAYNEQTGSPQTEQAKSAAVAAGVPVVNFTETLPQGSSYLAWMAANVSNLEQVLNAAAAK